MTCYPTLHELAILKLSRGGLVQKDIAVQLGVSQSYVSATLRNLRSKLHACALSSSRPLFTRRQRHILDLTAQGCTQVQIAFLEQISQSAVSQQMQAMKVKMRQIKQFSLTPRQEEIYALFRKGMTQKNIARKLGVSQPSVSHVVQAIKKKYVRMTMLRTMPV